MTTNITVHKSKRELVIRQTLSLQNILKQNVSAKNKPQKIKFIYWDLKNTKYI